MSPLTAGVDIGTTSVKAVAVDASGSVVARVRRPHRLLVPAPDRLEHDAAEAWHRGPVEALRRLGVEVAAVAVSSMVPSLTAVDGDGRPIGPGLLYGDARGEGTDELAGFHRWLAAEHPDAAGYWPAPAVANHALGGIAAVDIGTALAGGELFDTGDPRLPAVAVPGSALGRVTGSGAVLAAGGVDGMCEQLVAGAEHPGDVLVVCGTTLLVWSIAEEQREVPGLWTVPHVHAGRWSIGGASNAGGLFLEWVDRLAGPADGGPVDPWRVPVWVPYVRGERTPVHDPTRRAELHDLDLTHGPAAVRRAAWEAAGFVARQHVELSGIPARRIVATGGGTRVDGWMQALADATGLPVHVAAEPEGAARGAAHLARMALGGGSYDDAAEWARVGRIVEPDPGWADAVDVRYRRFRTLAAR